MTQSVVFRLRLGLGLGLGFGLGLGLGFSVTGIFFLKLDILTQSQFSQQR